MADILVGARGCNDEDRDEAAAQARVSGGKVSLGDKAGDVKDASLKAPPSLNGIVIDKKLFTRTIKDKRKRAEDKDALKKSFRNVSIDLFAFGPSLIQKVKGEYFLIAESLLFNLFVSKFRGT